MASMKGCEKGYYDKLKPQGKGRVAPSTFARNSLSMGGVNKGIEGSGKTSAGSTHKGKAMTGSSGPRGTNPVK